QVIDNGLTSAVNLTGSGGDDYISLDNNSTYDNTLSGGAGNGQIYSGSGNDTVAGGAGGDTIYSYGGNRTSTGGVGNDYLDPTYGLQSTDGGAGNDTIAVAADGNANTLTGGDGDDLFQLYYGGSTNEGTIDGGAGTDAVQIYAGSVDFGSTTLTNVE